MTTLPQAIQDRIAEWLSAGEDDEDRIDVFIGYEGGPVPLRATPAFIRRPEDVGRLIWDATCENNLAAFLPNYKGQKVGIMVKGCDSRAINGLLQEGQVERENLRIVGVSCSGVIEFSSASTSSTVSSRSPSPDAGWVAASWAVTGPQATNSIIASRNIAVRFVLNM